MKLKKTIALALALALMMTANIALAAEDDVTLVAPFEEGPQVETASTFAFTDVANDAYYADAVAWAAETGITTGRGDGIFDPDAAVTRAEAVTFLWRMYGEPAPSLDQTFADVEADPANAWYKDAVAWAVENGITVGTDTGFSPYLTCSRGMILTFLYRMEGGPLDDVMMIELPDETEAWSLEDLGNYIVQEFIKVFRSEGGFADVKEGDYFELPVIWASLNGILSENQIDVDARAVNPGAPCARGEMAYFLYGAHNYEESLASAGDGNTPSEPIETGTIPETVAMDTDDVTVTVTGIESDTYDNDPWLEVTVDNRSDKLLNVDVPEFYADTYCVSAPAFIPVEEEYWLSYENVLVPAGESIDFYISIVGLRDKGITALHEIEFKVATYAVTVTDEWNEYELLDEGDVISIKTSLYDESVSYDRDGVAVYDKDNLTVLVTGAKNNEYSGPEISVYAYNGTNKTVLLDLSKLKLDGEVCDANWYGEIPAGKRIMEKIYINVDYENVPTAKEAELTFCTLDENWETVETFDSVTVPVED